MVYFIKQDMTEEEKRRLLNLWIVVHRKKGTIWAIEKMMEALSIDAELRSGLPIMELRIDLKLLFKQDKDLDLNAIKTIFYAIEKYKNVKSILDYIDIRVTSC